MTKNITDAIDPAIEAYAFITEHKALSDLLQAEVKKVMTAFEEAAEIVHQHQRWGGQHIAALDLLGQRPLRSLQDFESAATNIKEQVEEVLRIHAER